jgi:hypothetical protein
MFFCFDISGFSLSSEAKQQVDRALTLSCIAYPVKLLENRSLSTSRIHTCFPRSLLPNRDSRRRDPWTVKFCFAADLQSRIPHTCIQRSLYARSLRLRGIRVRGVIFFVWMANPYTLRTRLPDSARHRVIPSFKQSLHAGESVSMLFDDSMSTRPRPRNS